MGARSRTVRRVAILATVAVLAGVMASATGVVDLSHPGVVARAAAADPPSDFTSSVLTLGGTGSGAETDGTGPTHSAFDGPVAVRLSTDGQTLYILDRWTNTSGALVGSIRKMALGSSGTGEAVTTLTTGLSDPVGLAVDKSGNVYTVVPDTTTPGDVEIIKVAPGGAISTVVTQISTGGSSLAVDPTSSFIYTDEGVTECPYSPYSCLQSPHPYRVPVGSTGQPITSVGTDLGGPGNWTRDGLADSGFAQSGPYAGSFVVLEPGSGSTDEDYSTHLFSWTSGGSYQNVNSGWTSSVMALSPNGSDVYSYNSGSILRYPDAGYDGSPVENVTGASTTWDNYLPQIPQGFSQIYGEGMAVSTYGVWAGDRLYLADTGNDVIRMVNVYPKGFRASSLWGGSNPAMLCWRCTLGEPVGADQGDLVESATDLSVSTRGPSLAMGRTYDSAANSVNGPLGYGWATTLTQSASQDAMGDWTITQENGSTVTFNPQGSGSGTTYTAPPTCWPPSPTPTRGGPPAPSPSRAREPTSSPSTRPPVRS